jgi:hypothetical protein
MHLVAYIIGYRAGLGPVFLVLVILRRITGSEPSSQTQYRWKGLALYSVYLTLYVVTWYKVHVPNNKSRLHRQSAMIYKHSMSPGRPDLNMPGVAEIV